jgi:hypothetical protein
MWATTRAGAGVFALVAALAWSADADAHPGFPPRIDTVLDLTGKAKLETAFPTMGCQLCHQSAGGGNELRPFGNLLVTNYGLSDSASIEDDASLDAAIMALEAGDPDAVTDLKAGMDPNNDPQVFQGALPTPTYGCSLSVVRSGDQPASVALAPLVLLIGARRLRKLTQRGRRSRSERAVQEGAAVARGDGRGHRQGS